MSLREDFNVDIKYPHEYPEGSENKLYNVSNMRRSSYVQWGRIKDEMRKCIVICANCHSIETKESYKK